MAKPVFLRALLKKWAERLRAANDEKRKEKIRKKQAELRRALARAEEDS